MKHRTLGKHGFEISEVALGCWQIGSDWGSTEEANSTAILQSAIDHGVTFFDTADVYGNGLSEEVIGKFIKETGAHIKIATKFGRANGVFPNGYSEQALRDAVNASRERLGVDSLDLLQLHCIPTQVLRDGYIFDWLRTIKQEGLISEFGASVESVEEGLICLEQEGLCSLQVIFNVFRQKLVNELFPVAKEKGVGIIVRLPLASGLLSGKFTKETVFPENDHRNYNKNGDFFNVGETFAGLPFTKGIELVEQLKAMLPETLTTAQMSLRWILDHDAVSCIIPGASRPEHIARNTEISNIAPLSDVLMSALADFYNQEVKQHIRGAY